MAKRYSIYYYKGFITDIVIVPAGAGGASACPNGY
jgi:hypothetical protein